MNDIDEGELKAATTISRIIRGHLARLKAGRLQLIKERCKLKLKALKNKTNPISEIVSLNKAIVNGKESEVEADTDAESTKPLLPSSSANEVSLLNIRSNKVSEINPNTTTLSAQKSNPPSRTSTAPIRRQSLVQGLHKQPLPSISDLLNLASGLPLLTTHTPIAELLANRCDDVSIITNNTKTVYTAATSHKPLLPRLKPMPDHQTIASSSSSYYTTPPRISARDETTGPSTVVSIDPSTIALPAPTITKFVKKQSPKPFMKIDGIEPKSYVSQLLREPPKPTKRTATRARQAEREKAAIEIQRMCRGHLARKLAKIRREQLADRFTCSRCGRIQLPAEYCNGCGRKQPRHISRRSSNPSNRCRNSGNRDDNDSTCASRNRNNAQLVTRFMTNTHTQAQENPYKVSIVGIEGLSKEAIEERHLLGDLFELEQHHKCKLEAIEASRAREIGLCKLRTNIWTQLQIHPESQVSQWNPSAPSIQTPQLLKGVFVDSKANKPPKELLAFTPGAKDFKSLRSKMTQSSECRVDTEVVDAVTRCDIPSETFKSSEVVAEEASINQISHKLEIMALPPVALDKRLESFCGHQGNYSTAPIQRGMKASKYDQNSINIKLPAIQTLSTKSTVSCQPRPTTEVGEISKNQLPEDQSIHLPLIHQKPSMSAPTYKGLALFRQVKV